MNSKENIIVECDRLIDTYHAGIGSLTQMLEVRRDLAVNYYYLTSHYKQAYGTARLSYNQRKFAIAKEIVAAKRDDTKAALELCANRAELLNASQEAREKEAWAEAEMEAMKMKFSAIKEVLAAMQQDISSLSHEARTTHYQTTHA